MKPSLHNLLAVTTILFLSFSGLAQSSYTYLLDLNKTEDGLLSVRLNTPAFEQEEILFTFPVTVPGYYNTDLQFGTMVTSFTAYDKWDMPLSAERVQPNQWRIQDAQRLQRIEYKVRNMWKYRLQNSVFLPLENFFLPNRVFMLNPGGLFGYVDGMENLPFYVYIVRPKGLFACSGIKGISAEGYRDAFAFPSYQRLTGHPILYTEQRPVHFQLGKTAVEIGVFSENKTVSPERIQKIYQPILDKLAHYMGDTLPVEKYAFLFFFYDGDIFTQASMEHGNSSVFVWPEQWDAKRLKAPNLEEGLERVDLHHFLHIYAPLNIHSKESMLFDFDEPKMAGSQHQWLYQGTTEYLFYHARVNQDMIPEKNFFWFVNDFLGAMKDFRSDVSLTEVSRRSYGSLKDQSRNLQLKGVVASLLLDIELRALSGGKYSMRHLVKDLAAHYGPYKAFQDEDLFDIIAEMTYPEIGEFLNAHVGGTTPLPINEIFNKVGMEYDAGDHKVYPKPEPSEEELALKEQWLFGE